MPLLSLPLLLRYEIVLHASLHFLVGMSHSFGPLFCIASCCSHITHHSLHLMARSSDAIYAPCIMTVLFAGHVLSACASCHRSSTVNFPLQTQPQHCWPVPAPMHAACALKSPCATKQAAVQEVARTIAEGLMREMSGPALPLAKVTLLTIWLVRSTDVSALCRQPLLQRQSDVL